MAFLSYAQNFEDVVLWRALQHVSDGFYIDIGAQHPIDDSVSKAFYERGWRGIHVEPVPAYASLLRDDRPDELVLQLALSDKEGEVEFHVISNTGLSTLMQGYANSHEVEHGFGHQVLRVPTRPIRSAFSAYEGRDIHWMKIDVEGAEELVLRGWDPARLRPWIMVIEATVPMSQTPSYHSWESILLDADYAFAYFDGLNRFYVAIEHQELAAALSTPPNVFDQVRIGTRAGSWCEHWVGRFDQAQADRERLEGELSVSNESLSALRDLLKESTLNLKRLESRERQLIQRASQAEAHASALALQAQSIYRSTSWRITAPMRMAGHPFRRISSALREDRALSGLRRRGIGLIRLAALASQKSPGTQKAIRLLLRIAPKLHMKLKTELEPAQAHSPRPVTLDGHALNPAAAEIFDQLSKLIPPEHRK